MVNWLLHIGADVSAGPAESEGMTALQAAVSNGHLEVVNLLLQAGADVNARPGKEQGRTALWAAVENGKLRVANRLLAPAQTLTLDPHSLGLTAMQAAVEGGNLLALMSTPGRDARMGLLCMSQQELIH